MKERGQSFEAGDMKDYAAAMVVLAALALFAIISFAVAPLRR